MLAARLPSEDMKIGPAIVGWLAVIMVMHLCGCSLHRVQEEAAVPAVTILPQFQEYAMDRPVSEPWNNQPWWESFEDPTLNQLIEEGLESNFSLQSFAARIEQAQALARQAGARLLPTLDASGRYEAEWDDQTISPSTRDREETTNAGGLLSWEVDLLGRLSSARKARLFEQEATVQDWLDARLLFSSAVAEQYFEIKGEQRQLEVLNEQIETNESLLELMTRRFGQGQASIVDVLQQREQLDETKARVPETQSRIGELRYTLEALLGKAPGTGSSILDSSFSQLPPLPEVGIPAALLQRRPDLRAAQQRLLALDHRVAEAVAQQFPTLRIGGGIDWQGDPDFGDSITSAFASLAAPIFAAGSRRAQVSLRKAQLDEALADYSNQFLAALTEVESTLLRERKLAERLTLVDGQLQTARRLLTEARNRFSQGLTDYLPVFTALIIVQNLERDIVDAQRNVLSTRVSLHRALGGPILPADPPRFLSSTYE